MIVSIMKSAELLNGKQKKWLRKHKHKLSVEQIAKELRISVPEAEKLTGAAKKANPEYETYFLQAVIATALLVFATSADNKFVSDDIAAILNNSSISTWKFVTSNLAGSLQNFIYFLVVSLTGLTPWPLRLLNIAFHLGSSVILYKILRANYEFVVAIVGCALFVFAPVTVEPVVWVSGMPYVLGGLLSLWCFYLHTLEKRTAAINFFEILLWILAMITVDKYALLPVLFVAWDWHKGRLKETYIVLAALLAITLAKGLSLIFAMGNRVDVLTNNYYNDPGVTMENPVAKVMIATGNYIWLYFWPKNITFYHSEVHLDWNNMLKYGSVFFVFYFCIWLLRKKIPDLWFWGGFVIFAMALALVPFKVGSLVAERYAYLSFAGMAVVTAMFINKYCFEVYGKKVTMALVVGLISILILRDLVRIKDWKDADTLWFSAEYTSPSSWQNHNNLGDAYVNLGNFPKAVEEFDKAIKINPRYADAMHNRSNAYLSMKETEKAKQGYWDSLKINPNLWESYLKLSSIEAMAGNFKAAIELAQKTIAINNSPELKDWLNKLLEADRMTQK